MRKKAYIYPVISREKTKSFNPYIDNFITYTTDYFDYCNSARPSGTGIFSLLKFIRKVDFVLLNWIEDLPDRRGGVIQTFFFLTILQMAKLFRVKIIWTLHNKYSHTTGNLFLKKLIFKNLVRKSDLIITHARDGIGFAESIFPGSKSRIFYFPHPFLVFNNDANKSSSKDFDILIWGTIAPYKAVDGFLELLEKSNSLERFRILIAGRAVSESYFKKIEKFENENITIRNQFVSNEDLAIMIRQTRAVLFTYASRSVLSSGALMDSLSHGALVIGPDTGAFSDLGDAGVIRTYKTGEDLMNQLEKLDEPDNNVPSDRISDYIKERTWVKFRDALRYRLEKDFEVKND